MEKLRVMIVDDDDVFLDELYEVLSLSGYDPFSFREGGAALKWALQARPDLILLDIKMEEMDGFQLSRELKRHPETAGIPVIAMTGHFTEEHHVAMMRACGMETCLKKPFNALNLLKRIAMVLDLKGRGRVKGAERRGGRT